MLNDLFVNVLILISFTFLGGDIIKEIPIKRMDKLDFKIILGICGGLLGVLMIFYNINVPGTTAIMDLRALVFMMINYVGGIIPTIIVGIIIGIFRIAHYGINESSVSAIINIILYLVSFNYINKKIKIPWKKWSCKLISVAIILISTFIYLLREMENPYIIIATFTGVIILAGVMEYFLLEYVRDSNRLLKMYKEDSTKDYLTGLNNTRNFDLLINNSFKTAIENNEKLSCLMLDIDHFKMVNDTYGHSVGDIILKELGEILIKNSRTFDIVGRVGGEEFCALLLDCPPNRSLEIGTKIRNAVKNHKFDIGEGRIINITISIGAATYPDNVESLEEIRRQADNALYKAKNSGRDKVCNNDTCIIE
ncbi:GGDEF domain-containing protein [Clostridium vincentii]|uniref:Response regulator PleD n=1 Tax=Clostridium vincentii TaxID=52704 RepID=A0A2T0BKE4_9CLOT|nr:GGDEF domain-containing protein [Clostridium vincentii]PRR84360.1 Response regulator PleD [Clostridium vincentii]